MLSTLLLQGTPVGNIPASIYEDLAADERVGLAVPIAMGDNVGGARIIGTDERFFELRPSLQEAPSFQFSEGRIFEDNFEAVLGSTAAASLGLVLGDRFVPAHGVELGLASDEHNVPHTVVGILEPSNTSYDNAVFTNVQSVIAIHAEHGDEAHVEDEQSDEAHVEDEQSDEAHAEDEHVDEAHAEDEHAHAAEGQITAVLVRPVGFVEGNELWRESTPVWKPRPPFLAVNWVGSLICSIRGSNC